jgi:hypothetical protein
MKTSTLASMTSGMSRQVLSTLICRRRLFSSAHIPLHRNGSLSTTIPIEDSGAGSGYNGLHVGRLDHHGRRLMLVYSLPERKGLQLQLEAFSVSYAS